MIYLERDIRRSLIQPLREDCAVDMVNQNTYLYKMEYFKFWRIYTLCSRNSMNLQQELIVQKNKK